MKTLQKIFVEGGRQYVGQYGHSMPGVHRKALRAMQNCRTGKMGRSHFSCPHCHRHESANCSCSNRHCPTCQAGKGLEWFDKHVQRMLPCNYFMVTFTVPTQMHTVIRSHRQDDRRGIAVLAHAAIRHHDSTAGLYLHMRHENGLRRVLKTALQHAGGHGDIANSATRGQSSVVPCSRL